MKDKTPIRQRILFAKFDEYVNMTPAQMAVFWRSEEAKKVSQDEIEASKAGGLSGKAVTRKIATMISKAAKFRGQFKNVPNWTPDEWRLCGSIVRYIARVYYGPGDLVDENGDRNPRSLAPMYWGFDILKRKSKLPKKEEIKTDVVDFVKKEREKEKFAEEKTEEKLKESFFSNLLGL